MKTSLLMLGLLLLGVGIAIVTAYIDGVLDDKCNSNNIDLYIKILLGLSVSCIVFSVSYFMCRLSCGKDMDLFDINGRVYLFVMALLCITTAVISGLLHTELNNNSCDFNNTYTIVLISTTSVLFAICLGLFIASFYYFRLVKIEDIEKLQKEKAHQISLAITQKEAAEAKIKAVEANRKNIEFQERVTKLQQGADVKTRKEYTTVRSKIGDNITEGYFRGGTS